MIGTYPARPPAQGLDQQFRRAWVAYLVLIDDFDRTRDYMVELIPTQVAFAPPMRRVYSGDALPAANPAPYLVALRVADRALSDPLRPWQTWWFVGELEGGAGCIGPAIFLRQDDDRPEKDRDWLVLRHPGGFTTFGDGSASPLPEHDGRDPEGRALSPYAMCFATGRLTLRGPGGAEVIKRFSLECNPLGVVVGGPEV